MLSYWFYAELHPILQNLLFNGPPIYDEIYLGQWLAFGTCVVGVYLRQRAFEALGEYFTYQIRVFNKHKLIQSGVYRYLVHPSYTGALLAPYGFLIFHNVNTYMLVISAFFAIVLLKLRIEKEERALKYQFKSEWDRHVGERYRLLPFIW